MERALFSTPRAGCSLHKHDHMLQGPSPREVPGSAPCLSRGPGDAQAAAGSGGHSPSPARAGSTAAEPAAVSGLQQPAAHPRGQHGQARGVRTAIPATPVPYRTPIPCVRAQLPRSPPAALRILPGPAELQ